MATTLVIDPKATVDKLKRGVTRAEKKSADDLSSLAERINAEHESCFGAANRALDHALRCGELLIHAKTKCAHGTWQAWLADNFRGSDRTARAYMRIAEHREAIDSKRQSSADMTIERALNYITPRREKVVAPDPQQLRAREQEVEDGLVGVVLDFDSMLDAAEAFGTAPDEAFKTFYANAGCGVDDVPTFEQHKAEVEGWRSAEWFPEAEKRVRAKRDNPKPSVRDLDVKLLRELFDEIDRNRKRAAGYFLEWMKESTALLADSAIAEDVFERIRGEAVWWSQALSVGGTWACHVKPGHWREAWEKKIAADRKEGAAK